MSNAIPMISLGTRTDAGSTDRATPPWGLMLLVLALGVAAAPLVCFEADMTTWWLPWATATRGVNPSAVYGANCNYPVVVPYYLTLAEAMRRWMGFASASGAMWLLIKLPNLLAIPLGSVVCWRWLRRPLGTAGARESAIAYVLCAPLFVNAAIWGQYESLLCLAMIASLCAAVNGAPIISGILLGAALSIKPQAIVLTPALGIFLLRRFSLPGVIAAVGACLATVLALSLPCILAGQGGAVRDAYTQAAGRYHVLSANAWNPWEVFALGQRGLRHVAWDDAHNDQLAILGPLTAQQIGLALLAAYTALLLACVWKRPASGNLLLGAGLSFFGFFMLPTEMHERYLVPAVAFFAMSGRDPIARRLFIGLSITASLNQLIVLLLSNTVDPTLAQRLVLALHTGSVAGAGANLGMLIWGTMKFWRRNFAALPADAVHSLEAEVVHA